MKKATRRTVQLLHVGQRVGRLLLTKRLGRANNKQTRWLCKCACGRYTVLYAWRILGGAMARCETCEFEANRHGMSDTRIYQVWIDMHDRVKTEKSYITKGVRVYDAWHDFATFAEDAFLLGYERHLVMHRVNNDGHYAPDNVAFVTPDEHARAHAWLKRGEHGLPPDVHASVDARRERINKALQSLRTQVARMNELGAGRVAYDEDTLPHALRQD